MRGAEMDAAKQMNDYCTIEDIYHLPEGKHAELIDGELYMMASPGTVHQELVMEFSYRIRDYIGKNDGSCKVFPSPFAVFLNANDEIYLEPDISVVCDPAKLTDKGCKGAPDWVIEIVSPSSRPRDYIKKMFRYHMAGVREYWIVDYEKNLVIVYNFEFDFVGNYTFSDQVKAGIFEDLWIDLSVLNGGT